MARGNQPTNQRLFFKHQPKPEKILVHTFQDTTHTKDAWKGEHCGSTIQQPHQPKQEKILAQKYLYRHFSGGTFTGLLLL